MNLKELKVKLDTLLKKSKQVLITSHISPDPDAICSVLSVYTYITKRFPKKKVRILISDKTGFGEIDLRYFERIEFVKDITEHLNDADLLICLDGNSYDRFSNDPDKLERSSLKTICIDHHPDTPDDFTLSIIDVKAQSACKLIADLLFSDERLLDKDVAETLMVGIMADTGTFDFIGPENAEVFGTAKRLIDAQKVSIRDLLQRYFTTGTKEFEIIQEFVKNTVNQKMKKLPNLSFSFIPRSFLKKYDERTIRRASKKFLYFFIRNIDGYPWGFVVIPTQSGFKMEFRSNPGAPDVGELAKEHFGGGGHKYSSGCGFIPEKGKYMSSREVCEAVLEKIVV